jgi:hypothetical protein
MIKLCKSFGIYLINNLKNINAMRTRSILLPVSLLVGGVLIFASCTKTGPQGPQGATGPTGPIQYGTITGSVIMSNQYDAPVTNAYASGYIVLKNSTTNATVDSVFANATSGVYTINNVATGTYNMECVYPGYGLNLHQNLEFDGGTLQADNKISAIPTFTVSAAQDTVRHKTATNYLYGSITADPNGGRTLLIFVGASPATSSAAGTYNFTTTLVIPADSANFTLTTALTTFYANGFTHGNTAYFAIYGASDNYTYGDYTNFTYGQTVYTAISAAPYNSSVMVTLP